ncbi:uncharacterized protein [Centruroides vittatus]|uniref:uncharacterized protein n=1 Tax=Centruroides vittatus TaxID=120091 RepID=UPI00350FBAB9
MGESSGSKEARARQERYERATKRRKSRQCEKVHQTEVSSNEEVSESIVNLKSASDLCNNGKSTVYLQTENEKGVASMSQTELTSIMIHNLEQECDALRKELATLKATATINDYYSLQSFQGNDEKTRFFTGMVNFNVLLAVFDLCSSAVQHSEQSKLTQFREFLMCLMRFRMSLCHQDLAYRFHVSRSTVSRILEKWTNVLYVRLSDLIHWPDRDILQQTMPSVFKNCLGENIAIIIDCFEIFIDRPSSLISRAQTWSQYKHHNTIKFLIGVTPQGTVSFISEPWGGRVSDQYLTEHSGFLNYLNPGDIILADRGFNIADSVGFYCAKLLLPAYTRGKKQLSATDVMQSRKLSHLRIHVERVIGRIRNQYRILQSTLSIELLTVRTKDSVTTIEKIVTICCALINLSNSVVPFD